MRTLWNLLVFVIACYAGYRYGRQVGYDWIPPRAGLSPTVVWVIGGVIVATAIIWTGNRLADLIAMDLAGTTSPVVRVPVGMLWHSVVSALCILSVGFIAVVTASVAHAYTGHTLSDLVAGPLQQLASLGWNLALALSLLAVIPLPGFVRQRTGELIAPLRRIWRSHKAGKGGSAAMAGMFEEWRLMWKRGGLLLGASLYGWCRHLVGMPDDRHALTIAANGAGKGRAAIIPNLLTWPHSAIVIDPKGTNAAVTGGRRGKGLGRVRKGLGQRVYVVNPFHVNANLPYMPLPSRFNPLSILDPESTSFYEDVDIIADALVITSGNDFFDLSGKGAIRAAIAFSSITHGKKATLSHVRLYLSGMMGENSPVLAEMLACGGIVADAIAQVANAEERVRSSIIVTALQHTDWLVSEAMQEALSESDFSIFDLKEEPTTLYLVIPPEFIDTHARFLRLFINICIRAASTGGRSPTPILFLLDEFYSLGPMTFMSKAIGLLRSYNIKIWPILQNLTQLVELYPKNWETFIANTGFLQIFGINDAFTAEYITKRLGQSILYTTEQGGVMSKSIVDLRDRVEVTQEASRISGKQIVFREGEDPLVLQRVNYDEVFSKTTFNPDPDHH